MTSRQKRALRRQFEDQIRLERNGAPPPPEIAAGMTKPRPLDLFQVTVDTRAGPRVVGPAGPREMCEMLAHAVRGQIALGRERLWSNPTVGRVIRAAF